MSNQNISNRFKLRSANYLNLLLILVLVVLLNWFSALFLKTFRWDLTEGNAYTLSKKSKDLVSSLAEPMTIRVFYSDNLDSRHKDIERYLRDLLQEYKIAGNRFFSYEFLEATENKKEKNKTIAKNIELAQNLGVQPGQIQSVERDQLQVVAGYLAAVIQNGDFVERIQFINQAENIEFKISKVIEEMNRKVSSLLALDGKIEVRLHLSQDLMKVAPFFDISGLDQLEPSIREAVAEVQDRNFNQLVFSTVDSRDESDQLDYLSEYGVNTLGWKSFTSPSGERIEEGEGVAALEIRNGERNEIIPLLVSQMAFTGQGLRQVYQLREIPDYGEVINLIVDSILNINDDLAYLADKGSVSLSSPQQRNPMMQQQQQQGAEGELFNQLMSELYNVESLSLKDLDERYPALVLAGISEELSDSDLFKIDQYLMAGRNLIIFHDAFTIDNSMAQYGMAPRAVPNRSGLNKLLEHYGVKTRSAMVLDSSSYKQPGPQGNMNFYHLPIITGKGINDKLDVFRNINGMVAFQNSPLEFNATVLSNKSVKAMPVLETSERSWLMEGNINLDPRAMQPPVDEEQFSSYPIAALLEGEFTSYFADKPLPSAESNTAMNSGSGIQQAEGNAGFREKSRPAKIFVFSSSEPVKSQLLGASRERIVQLVPEFGILPDFLQNVVDYMSGREDWAVMRSKSVRYNPIEPFDENAGFIKRFLTNSSNLKFFNVVLLPALVILLGALAYVYRNIRRDRILTAFKEK